jgi:hypothetical protein
VNPRLRGKWHRVLRRPFLTWRWWDWRRHFWERYFWQRIDERIHESIREYLGEKHRHDEG